MGLKGKIALITGSTSGIGLGIAHGLADEGVNIVINGLGDTEEIEKQRKIIEAKDVKCVYIAADMTKPDQIAAMMKQAQKQFGAIDILVNNAGIQHVSAIETFPPEKWDAIIAGDEGKRMGPNYKLGLRARTGCISL